MKRQWPRQDFKDPVCGMEISLSTAQAEVEHRGKRYYFCSPMCRDRFVDSPESYLREPRRE